MPAPAAQDVSTVPHFHLDECMDLPSTPRSLWRHLRVASALALLILPGWHGGAASSSGRRAVTTLRYLILRCDAQGAVYAPTSDAELRAIYDGPVPSVATWFSDISEGQFVFEIIGLQHVPVAGSPASYLTANGYYTNQLDQDCARGAIGVDWNTVDGVLIHPNFNGGGAYGGTTTLSLPSGAKTIRRVAIQPSGIGLQTALHEVGHTIGWLHSGADYPGPDHVYDTGWDVMGLGLFGVQTIAVNRAFSGWIPAERRTSVTPGAAREFDLEIVGSGRQGARLPGSLDLLDIVSPDNALRWTAEARIARGLFEQHLPASGVILHRLLPEVGCCKAKLIDTDGNGNSKDEGTYLVPGERYEVADGVGIEVVAATTNGYRVRAWSAWTLSVVVRGSGTVSGIPGTTPCFSTTCRSLHGVPGLTTTLTATPLPSETFRGWRGACTGLGSCTVRLDKTDEVVAWFGTQPLLVGVHARPYGVVGRPYADTLQVDVAGAGGISISATGLPAGLTLNTTTGRISGTPVAATATAPIVTMTTAGGTTVDTVSLNVVADVAAVGDSIFVVRNRPIWLPVPPGGTGALARAGRLISGVLPVGLGFRADGAFGGTATGAAEVKQVTLGYTLPTGAASGTYHVVVLDRMPTITTAPPGPEQWLGGPFSMTLAVEANDPVTWRVIGGGLPPGITLSGNMVRGDFLGSGSYSFGLEARRGSLADTLAVAFDVVLPSIGEGEVVTRFLRGIPLYPPTAAYLDHIGNRNARIDAGDIRAWLISQGLIRRGTP